jgi:glycosyltransferase involved in cell wall biosynthesis
VTPTVSVCIPTYNGEEFIERTLESVLAQHYKDFEIVLGDDGSTDATLEVVSACTDERLRIAPGTSGGSAPANFNRLIEAARGRYVKVLCQDDMIYPDCLGRQVEAMERGAEQGAVLVSCKRDIVDDDDRVVVPNRGWRNAAGVIDGARAMRANVRAGTNLIGEPSATLCSREVLLAVGGYSLDQTYMVDLDLWMRMLDRGNLVYLPEPLCTFRVSRTSWSSRLARQQAREARKALRSVHATHPTTIRRSDLAIGLTKPTVLAVARRAVFVLSPVLPSRRGSGTVSGTTSPEVL